MSFINRPKYLTFLSIAAASIVALTSCAKEKKETKEILSSISSLSKQSHTPLKDRVRDGIFSIIKGHEDYLEYVYLCKAGKLTCGYGSNIESPARQKQLVFTDSTGRRLSPEEISARFKALAKVKPMMRTGRDKQGRPIYNIHHQAYRKFDLFVTKESAEKLYKKDINQAFDALSRNFRSAGMDIEKVPFPIVIGAMDIQYNTGKFTKEAWPKCYAGLQIGHNGNPRGYYQASLETDRGQVSKERNDLVRKLFENGAAEAEQRLKTNLRMRRMKKTR